MSQKHIDTLISVTDSRYRLAMVVGRRAGQLKHGVPSTVTGKAIARNQNAVSVAMEELAQGTGVVWGKDLPSAHEIRQIVEQDRQHAQREAERFSVTRHEEAEPEGSQRLMYRART